MFSTQLADWSTDEQDLCRIRYEVFVNEQGVPPELEVDGEDETAIHVAAFIDDAQVVGTGRMLTCGKIGRMAVLRAYRQKGIGRALLDELVKEGRKHNLTRVYLGAQLPAIPFYKRAGFSVYGDVFLDAGIDHQMMELFLAHN